VVLAEIRKNEHLEFPTNIEIPMPQS